MQPAASANVAAGFANVACYTDRTKVGNLNTGSLPVCKIRAYYR